MQILGNRVLVKPMAEKETKSGIILPESKSKVVMAEVVLLGKKVKFVKTGNVVKHWANTGTSINYRGDDLLLINENDIISIV